MIDESADFRFEQFFIELLQNLIVGMTQYQNDRIQFGLGRSVYARGMAACPGFFTPAEAFALLGAGADALKLFPAEAASPAVLKALLAVLPKGTAILPVGGMAPETIPAWKAAGAAGYGIGSSLYRPGDTPSPVRAKAKALRVAAGMRLIRRDSPGSP